jgi:hypothetical protein
VLQSFFLGFAASQNSSSTTPHRNTTPRSSTTPTLATEHNRSNTSFSKEYWDLHLQLEQATEHFCSLRPNYFKSIKEEMEEDERWARKRRKRQAKLAKQQRTQTNTQVVTVAETDAAISTASTTDRNVGKATNTQQAKGDIGGDWSELLDPASGHLYYLHNSTGISQWTRPENVVPSWQCVNILCTQEMEMDITRCVVCYQDRQRKTWKCKKCSKMNFLLAKNCSKCSAFPPGNWQCAKTGCKHINTEGPDLSHNEICKKCLTTDRRGKTQGIFELYMMAMDELQQKEWLDMREHNLKFGMSKNHCLARKDCHIRVQADLQKAPGPIARKVIAFGIGASFCAMLSMFGVVFFFILNYCVIQNVQMTVGKPAYMNVSEYKNNACSGLTFTPSSQAAIDILQRQMSTNTECGNSNRVKYLLPSLDIDGNRIVPIDKDCRIESNIPSVFLFLQPQNGHWKKNISDSYCWKATNVTSNNNVLPYSVPPLIFYATLLGLFVGLQELLNLAPAGHKCTKLGVKDRFCINGCQCCCSKLRCPFSNISGMLFGELFYYLTFVSGYNVTMNLFLTMGIDLSGYDQVRVSNSEYKGGGLWVSEIGADSSTPLLGLVASSFVFCMVNFVCKLKYLSRENCLSERDQKRTITQGESGSAGPVPNPCGCCYMFIQLLYRASILGMMTAYAWMSYTQLVIQFGRLRFSSIVFPTLDFRLMHVDLTITLTVACSVVLGFSRTLSMCIKTWSSVVSSAGANLKSFATESHMLRKTKKVHAEELAKGAVQNKIEEEIENGAMDRTVLQEQEERKHHSEKIAFDRIREKVHICLNENWQNAKTVMHQQHASIQSQRIQQKAHDASIDHQNRLLKKKHMANRRLQKRLSARGGSGSAVLPVSFQVQPLEPIQKTSLFTTKVMPNVFNERLVTNYVDQHETAMQVIEIRKKSETARQTKLNEVNAKQKLSAVQLQRRLSQRVARGTGKI